MKPGDLTRSRAARAARARHCGDWTLFTTADHILRLECGRRRHSDKHHRRRFTDRKGRTVTVQWDDRRT